MSDKIYYEILTSRCALGGTTGRAGLHSEVSAPRVVCRAAQRIGRGRSCGLSGTGEEGPLRPDHVYMLLGIPPKYSMAVVVGYLQGKSAMHIARTYYGKERHFTGENFWVRSYFVFLLHIDYSQYEAFQIPYQ
jgi:hypothetical protein